MINFIDKKEKYTFSDTLTISLPVPTINLPSSINIDGDVLYLKSNFHVTLVPIGKIKEKYNLKIDDFSNLILKDFSDFISSDNIDLIEYNNEFRFVTDNDLKTIIVMCKVSNLDKFFELINKKYNLTLETPPTHVTLYTLKDKLGIFLIDSEDLEYKTKIIKIPELKI